ncbi:MAG: acyltransferase, partial [Arthrobacter sp.]|nr:acyltransferase [Arthrobacter sp.]
MTATLTTSVVARHLRRGGTPGVRRTDIQGLRAFAVLVVVLSHARIPGMTGGYIGVDVFFVISGFLITSLLLREIDRTGRISIRRFYERRALRILPAGTVVLVATVLYAAMLLPMGRLDAVATDAIWSAFFLANVHFALEGTDYFAGTTVSPLQHFWSLAVEEQFYLVWPLVLLGIVALIARRRRRPPITRLACLAVAVIIAGSMIASGIETALSPTTAYFSTVDRAYELAGGALLAILTAAGTRLPRWYAGPPQAVAGWLGLAALLFMVVAWNEATPIPGLLGGLVVLATAAVLASGIGGLSGPCRLLSLRPMQFFGDISYSLYLWHWPLLTLGLLPGLTPHVRVPLLIATAVALAA